MYCTFFKFRWSPWCTLGFLVVRWITQNYPRKEKLVKIMWWLFRHIFQKIIIKWVEIFPLSLPARGQVNWLPLISQIASSIHCKRKSIWIVNVYPRRIRMVTINQTIIHPCGNFKIVILLEMGEKIYCSKLFLEFLSS